MCSEDLDAEVKVQIDHIGSYTSDTLRRWGNYIGIVSARAQINWCIYERKTSFEYDMCQ